MPLTKGVSKAEHRDLVYQNKKVQRGRNMLQFENAGNQSLRPEASQNCADLTARGSLDQFEDSGRTCDERSGERASKASRPGGTVGPVDPLQLRIQLRGLQMSHWGDPFSHRDVASTSPQLRPKHLSRSKQRGPLRQESEVGGNWGGA